MDNLMRKSWPVILLIVLNAIVLLGQLWPEGAPPFARTVNIAFLLANLVFLSLAVSDRKRRPRESSPT